MFEITGNDIASLGDADLRILVFRLAVAELRANGAPLSSVTAGGDQDAADGGIDVRVACPVELKAPDFVPRRYTGFQVKKSDMPAGAIRDEMRPKGVLRNSIRELADAAGAYVIVSAQGSVTETRLAERREAMCEALHDIPSASQFHTDFYDRNRLATWVDQYPGICAWVRAQIGRPLSGWSGISTWMGTSANPEPYLFNEKACLIDEGSRKHENLTISEGIERLRVALRQSKQCIRLIGLSGLGKTRLVQALFENGVGETPLDSSLGVYTDYSEVTNPTARDMARDLIARRQRAILVVDNCNPETHAELARLCASKTSEVSLITVEYDVRDDEPEHTDVFRLQSSSLELVAEWIKGAFPAISQLDRDRIAGFSDGNFRVARAIAQTLKKGETLGRLKDRQLFERIFQQSKGPNQELLQAAQDLSLLYSIDGEDVSNEGELSRVGAIRGVSPSRLYESLVEMRKRGVVQARGRFRAILPQAIANPLAADAIDRIPAILFDQFCAGLTARMLKSVARRLGFLHDSSAAQQAVARWLCPDGPIGDLFSTGGENFSIVESIAPVAPEAVLTRIENRPDLLVGRSWIGLVKAIGYEASLFDRVAMLLAPIAGAEQESNNLNATRNVFSELFRCMLSGTQAKPEQRRLVIRKLASSSDETLRKSATIALTASLETGGYMCSPIHDFGARPRDFGWSPESWNDVTNWFQEAILLVIDIVPDSEARILIARQVRGVWQYPSCLETLEKIASTFVQKQPWIEGWIAVRATLRYDREKMSEEVRTRLERLAEQLKPLDLLHRARAVVFNRTNHGWDFIDGEDDDVRAGLEKADKIAEDLGRAFAKEHSLRAEFVVELLAESQALRAFQFGRGLATAVDDHSKLWRELVTAYERAEIQRRNPTVLCGFLHGVHECAPPVASEILEAAVDNSHLARILPRLQASAKIDAEGIARLRNGIAKGGVVANDFFAIANGHVSQSPSEELVALLEDLSALTGGVEVAIEILHMHLFRKHDGDHLPAPVLIAVGRYLLGRVQYAKERAQHDYTVHELILICFSGETARGDAIAFCTKLYMAMVNYSIYSLDVYQTLEALFQTQPRVALDAFLLAPPPKYSVSIFDRLYRQGTPVEAVGAAILKEWADLDPNFRYPLLGKQLRMFGSERDQKEHEISNLFLSVMAHAPNKRLFLGDFHDRLHPRSWSGSLSDIFSHRKGKLMSILGSHGPELSAWIHEGIPELERWIERDREMDRSGEERFE